MRIINNYLADNILFILFLVSLILKYLGVYAIAQIDHNAKAKYEIIIGNDVSNHFGIWWFIRSSQGYIAHI